MSELEQQIFRVHAAVVNLEACGATATAEALRKMLRGMVERLKRGSV